MFERHKCKIETIDEVEVFNTNEVQELYRKVNEANLSMKGKDVLQYAEREIVLHQDNFTIFLEKNDLGLFLVPVYVDGAMYRFILDTGAQISSIASKHTSLVETHKTTIKMPIKSASGSIKEVPTINVDILYFGALEIHHQPFVVLDSDNFKIPIIKKEVMEFDGIIGWDILSQLDFELAPEKGMFSVVKLEDKFTYCNLMQAAFPTVIVYDEKKKPAIFGIDTGAKESWLNAEYCKKNNVEVGKDKRIFGFGVLGIERMKIQLIKELQLRFASTKITLENTRTGDTGVFVGCDLDGVFGNEIFKKHKIQFLNSKGIVRVLE